MVPRAAYVHVPFCRHRCGYCNFTVIAGRDDLVDAFLEALAIELGWLESPRQVDTLYLGGGTPSHLPPAALARLLSLVTHWFPLAAGGEFSLEANPGDLHREKLSVLAEAGVNRLSVGVQSFHEPKLRLLERDHDPLIASRGLAAAREVFPGLSVDLIFGTPADTPGVWETDLAQALAHRPDHVSTYGLTYEKGTTFWSRRSRGEIVPIVEEDERDQYLRAIDELTRRGFAHYEVSNFSLPGKRCRHNEVYWSGDEYYAAGPGASRYVAGRRETNHKSTTTWIKRIRSGQSPVAEAEKLSPEDRAREALVLGLRRIDGVHAPSFAARFGYAVEHLLGRELTRLAELGLIATEHDRLRLTREGLLVSDSIWPRILRR